MAIPFTVDISAFYGEPDFREQDSGTIVDRRKTLNLHKELEAPVQSKRGKKRGATKRTSAKSAGAIAFNGATKDTGGAIAFNDVNSGGGCKSNASGGAIGFSSDTGGALAFNEAQLMNELTGLKKGGALGTLAATIIPALIQMAPQIISTTDHLESQKFD